MEKDFFVIANNIRSLHNVGSVFRTADAFGVSKLFLTGYTGKPPDPKIDKVALGAEKFLPWEYYPSAARLIAKLKKDQPKLTVYGLENNLPKKYKAKILNLNKFTPAFPAVILLGEEAKGIPAALLPKIDKFVEIPMLGQKESLNVSVAFGVAANKFSSYGN